MICIFWLFKNSDQSESEIRDAKLWQLWQKTDLGYHLNFETGVSILSHVQDKLPKTATKPPHFIR